MAKTNIVLEGRDKGRDVCINKNCITIVGDEVTKETIYLMKLSTKRTRVNTLSGRGLWEWLF